MSAESSRCAFSLTTLDLGLSTRLGLSSLAWYCSVVDASLVADARDCVWMGRISSILNVSKEKQRFRIFNNNLTLRILEFGWEET